MDFNIQTKITPFVENQFPQFYLEEGPNFVEFLKAYYEWMEASGKPIKEARELFNYRDIDNTVDEFLEFFQKKYLYGIPFNVIINKRYLLKHILDVYRSKSSIQGYKLLFRLIYDEDVEVYIPGRDILRVSHGTWREPKYIEVTASDLTSSLIGKQIIGVISRTTAIVENIVTESFGTDIINIVYISNVLPKGSDFTIGEKIVDLENRSNTTFISSSASVIGSLDYLNITNGGQDFEIGDIVKINRANNHHGVQGILKVTDVSLGFGTLYFDIVSGGAGFTTNAYSYIYPSDGNGSNASFSVGAISDVQSITYNTDVICDYMNLTLDATAYDFVLSSTANLTSNVGDALTYTNNNFGTIASLTGIFTGNGYTQPADVYVRSTLISKPLSGNVSYDTTSNTVTGVSTIFTSVFVNNSVIILQDNSTVTRHLVRQVTNSTSLQLYQAPSVNSTSEATYKVGPTVLPSNFAIYETYMARVDDQINGENDDITSTPSAGNNVVQEVMSISSGKGYIDGELVSAYLYGAISNTVTILNGGVGYTNGDPVIFSGSGSGKSANAAAVTDSNGTMTGVTVTYNGSGYYEIPTVSVRSNTGSGAILTTTVTEFNYNVSITGRVSKAGIGRSRGYWSTTKGFLNSNKYLQDSYYYQDFSYEFKVALPLYKYRDILYNTFHTAGTEIFGKYLLNVRESSNLAILAESTSANTTLLEYITSDEDTITADSDVITSDRVTI